MKFDLCALNTFSPLTIIIDTELNFGTHVSLPSHGYPYYPANAYVLWTFQFAQGVDSADAVYQIAFGSINIGRYDYLRIGYGWDPNNASALVVTYGNDYRSYTRDIFLNASNICVEFATSSSYESSGFRLDLLVRNLTGRSVMF